MDFPLEKFIPFSSKSIFAGKELLLLEHIPIVCGKRFHTHVVTRSNAMICELMQITTIMNELELTQQK
jgi:hypothetical protein